MWCASTSRRWTRSEFESLLERGRSQLGDDPGAAAGVLRAGLQLWRGSPFAGLDDTGVLLAERTRLEDLQLCWRWRIGPLRISHTCSEHVTPGQS